MKKVLSVILVCALALFCVVSCKKANSSSASNSYDTVTPGVLTVATSPDFAPYEFYAIDENGKATLAGFDMALAQYIADFLGLELEVVPMDFDGTLMELSQKNVDLSLAGYSPDPEREGIMDFSDLYYQGGQSFICLNKNASKFKSLKDLNAMSLTVAAQVGAIQMDLAEQYSEKADKVGLVKVTDIIAEVLSEKVDGAYMETVVAETYQKNYPDICVVLPVPYDQEGSAVGVSKGNTALLEGVNAAIKAALADGSMAKFIAEANELASGNIYEGLLD